MLISSSSIESFHRNKTCVTLKSSLQNLFQKKFTKNSVGVCVSVKFPLFQCLSLSDSLLNEEEATDRCIYLSIYLSIYLCTYSKVSVCWQVPFLFRARVSVVCVCMYVCMYVCVGVWLAGIHKF